MVCGTINSFNISNYVACRTWSGLLGSEWKDCLIRFFTDLCFNQIIKIELISFKYRNEKYFHCCGINLWKNHQKIEAQRRRGSVSLVNSSVDSTSWHMFRKMYVCFFFIFIPWKIRSSCSWFTFSAEGVFQKCMFSLHNFSFVQTIWRNV